MADHRLGVGVRFLNGEVSVNVHGLVLVGWVVLLSLAGLLDCPRSLREGECAHNVRITRDWEGFGEE
jgi:hypothetical protein